MKEMKVMERGRYLCQNVVVSVGVQRCHRPGRAYPGVDVGLARFYAQKVLQ